MAIIADQAFQPQPVCGIFGFVLAVTRAFQVRKSESARIEASWAMKTQAVVKLKLIFYAILIDHFIEELRLTATSY